MCPVPCPPLHFNPGSIIWIKGFVYACICTLVVIVPIGSIPGLKVSGAPTRTRRKHPIHLRLTNRHIWRCVMKKISTTSARTPEAGSLGTITIVMIPTHTSGSHHRHHHAKEQSKHLIHNCESFLVKFYTIFCTSIAYHI